MVVEEKVEHQLAVQQKVDEEILLQVEKKVFQEENQMLLEHMESIFNRKKK
jgi:hypothetical protein